MRLLSVHKRLLYLCLLCLLALPECLLAEPHTTVISTNRYHLGVAGFPEWEEFAQDKPYGRQLALNFVASPNAAGHTLFIRQRDVKETWEVVLNGKKLGTLIHRETPLVAQFPVPPQLIHAGTNSLFILPPKANDDIELADIRLINAPLTAALGECTLSVTVTEAPTGHALPCRITITDATGALTPLIPLPLRVDGQPVTNAAVQLGVTTRTGVIYTRDGKAKVSLLPGTYTVYASRGMEYSAPSQQITVQPGDNTHLNLSLLREVNTEGWVSADTHIHTLTYSGHGDATIDERMLTIAGEGLEVPIATDHNHNTDYSEAALRTKLREHFTSAIGNEVTTKVGHFNAFPIKPGSPIPGYKSTNWTVLLQDMRNTPGVQVITLNHPRDLHSGFIPFAATNYNPLTGEHIRLTNELFDAMEVITSGALQSDVRRLYHDWFGLLNHGYHIMSVGSSDTHDVSRYILGQGRTYIMADDHDPAHIDITQVCRNLRAGRAVVSLGLFVNMDVAQKYYVGDVATNLPDEFIVTVHADSSSWSWVQNVELYADGVKIRSTDYLQPRARLRRSTGFVLKRPFHDVYLVGLAFGPGVTAPFADTPKPYQPASRKFTPHVIGSTNPIWIDGDGDGKYTSPRGYAEQLVRDYGLNPDRLLPALTPYDEAIMIQTLALCHERGMDFIKEDFQSALKIASPKLRSALKTYLQSFPAK